MSSIGWFRWIYRLQRASGRGRVRSMFAAFQAFKPAPF